MGDKTVEQAVLENLAAEVEAGRIPQFLSIPQGAWAFFPKYKEPEKPTVDLNALAKRWGKEKIGKLAHEAGYYAVWSQNRLQRK